MRERILNNLGLMRRASAIAIGEENTGTAARSGAAKLVCLAADASDNARKRAEGFVYGREIPLLTLPFSKAEIAAHVGLSGCSMAAVTDGGFAGALVKNLAAGWPEDYGPVAGELLERWKAPKAPKKAAQQKSKTRRKNA